MQINGTKHVLVIEDARDIQILVARLLKRNGYLVDCADNGQIALDMLKSTPKLPNVILLDLMMPVMDGIEFREEQEKIAKVSDIPVIVMSADSDAQTKAARIGAKGFLKKPFDDIPSFLHTIESCIRV